MSYLLPSILYPMSWLLTSSCMNMDEIHSAPHLFSAQLFRCKFIHYTFIHYVYTCMNIRHYLLRLTWEECAKDERARLLCVCMHSSSFICLEHTYMHTPSSDSIKGLKQERKYVQTTRTGMVRFISTNHGIKTSKQLN